MLAVDDAVLPGDEARKSATTLGGRKAAKSGVVDESRLLLGMIRRCPEIGKKKRTSSWAFTSAPRLDSDEHGVNLVKRLPLSC
jgi:hypothetical protein